MIWILTAGFFVVALGVVCFCIFFDQAIINRHGTIYRGDSREKKVALTFDDGPSPVWTPKILDELKKANIKATFFMVGHHVQKYPEIAKRVASDGHIIANHGYAHSVILYYTPAEIEEEIKYTEYVIKQATGQTTQFFRPPKSWLRKNIKNAIKSMGYDIVLWSRNSKDWVGFPHHWIVKHIAKNIQNGDILLFHDSGSITSVEGGDRTQTVKSIGLLTKILKDKGFQFLTLKELIYGQSLV